jgi:hypothetical protein
MVEEVVTTSITTISELLPLLTGRVIPKISRQIRDFLSYYHHYYHY